MARLSIGEKMPNFVFNTHCENKKTVVEILKEKKRTVFWVLRYIGCPICRLDIHSIAACYDKFLENDTQVYVVMQSDPAIVQESLKDAPLPFNIICDTNMEIYKTLQITATSSIEEMLPRSPADIAKFEKKLREIEKAGFVHGKHEGNEQQLPAMFVVEQDGTVSYSHYANNIVDMPTVEQMLEIIKKLM